MSAQDAQVRHAPEALRGLSAAQAAQRLLEDGPNALPSDQHRTLRAIVRETLQEPMFMLLLAAGNWEVWMAQYNLQTRFRNIDIGFLLDMPGRVLPELVAHRAHLAQVPSLTTEDEYGLAKPISAAEAVARIDAAVAAWQARNATQSDWQSVTYADWQTSQQLKAWQPMPPAFH